MTKYYMKFAKLAPCTKFKPTKSCFFAKKNEQSVLKQNYFEQLNINNVKMVISNNNLTKVKSKLLCSSTPFYFI